MNTPPDPDRPPAEPKRPPFDWRTFARRVGTILAGDLALAAIYTLVLGPRSTSGFATVLFVSAGLLLAIAALPGFNSMRPSLTLMRPAAGSAEGLRARMREDRERREKDEPITFTFGAAGLLAMLLSLALSRLPF